jgi:hypothetical protein
MNRGQRKNIFEAVGLVAIVASLIFLGLEIRQANLQARAAAFQAIGIATAEWHYGIDDRVNRLLTEANYPEAIERWTLADWERYRRVQLSGARLFETLLLQVEQGLLDVDALNSLGYSLEEHPEVNTPAYRCVWPDIREFVSDSLRSMVEQSFQANPFDCPIDIQVLRDQTVLGDTTR